MRRRGDWMEVTGTPAAVCPKTTDDRFLGADRRGSRTYYFMQRNGKDVIMSGYRQDGTFTAVQRTLFADGGSVTGFAVSGEFVVMSTSAGLRYLHFNGSGYDSLGGMGNPGIMEYRGVYVQTGQEVFKVGPYHDGTNNIGEFLAIVHGLALLKQKGSNIPIYSDSKIAQKWVRDGKCRTTLAPTSRNAELLGLVARAEKWLATNTYTNPIIKWETKQWGEIPADFGRKG